jgi:hypothetical protein
MASTDAPDSADAMASHTLAYLRSHGKKLDLVLETLARQSERLGRLEREVGEVRRDLLEMKSDIVLLENKALTAQTEILTVLYRLDQRGIRADEASGAPSPTME